MMPCITASPPKRRTQSSQPMMAKYPMINPATARPWPCKPGAALILERARCPQTTPPIPVSTTGVQQNPQTESKLRTSDQMASGSVGDGAGADVTEPPAVEAATAGTLGIVAPVGGGPGADVPPDGLLLTPGTVESGAQPAAPSYHAWSERLSVPAANWRFTSLRGKGPVGCPLRAI
jgi:hypothetical protein